MSNRIEKETLGLPPATRDQPELEWMKLVGHRMVAKVDWSIPLIIEEEQFQAMPGRRVPKGKDIYTFDVPTGQLRPVASPQQGPLVDFSLCDECIVALSSAENQFNLLTYRAGAWQSERLPDYMPVMLPARIVVNDNLLLLFTGGGAFLRIGKTWHPFVELFHTAALEIPQHMLCTEDSVYVGYNAGEWGGALFRFDKSSHGWEECSQASLPVTGIAQSPKGHVWVSAGLAHLSLLEAAIDKWDGAYWSNIVPESVSLPEESDITGIAFMPSGDLRIVAGTLGLLEVKDNVLHTVFGVNWYETGDSLYTQGLVIDPDGRNFVGIYDAGIVLFQTKDGELTVRRLTFNTDAPAVSLEEFTGDGR